MKLRIFLSFLVTIAVIGALTFLAGRPAKKTTDGRSSNLIAVPDAPEFKFTEDDNGHTVEIPVGKTFIIELPENSTTGYQWDIPQDMPKGLNIITHTYEPPASIGEQGTMMVGQPGKAKIWVRVGKRGLMPLTLAYIRSFEKNTPPAQTWHIIVNGVE